MAEKTILILGSGRLAHKTAKLFRDQGFEATQVSSREFVEIEETEVEESSMDYARTVLVKNGIEKVSAVCVVDSDDAVNVYLLMAALAARRDVPVYAAFFNESLVSELVDKNRNIKIFNPASIVSKLFVDSIPDSISENEETETLYTYNDNPNDKLPLILLAGFIWLMVSGAIFFHLTEGVGWMKSFYFAITVITGVNFGDVGLVNYGPIIEILRMGLMVATWVYVILALAFIVDHIVKRHTDILLLGRRRYRKRGHVIVCGLGRVGYAIVQDLLIKGEDVIVIEIDENNKYLSAVRAKKMPVLIGDATLVHYLIDAGVGKAKALICATDKDRVNLVIGLNARVENKNTRLLLRISDQSTAEEMKKNFSIHYVFSKSFATAKAILDSFQKKLVPSN